MEQSKRAHAVVIGGSLSGLCVARALADQFDRITVIERDQLPIGAEHRPGTPQSHHVHALLLRGLIELERLFPGIENELRAAGAARMDLGNDVAHCTEWGWARRAPTEVAPLTLSRLLLESTVRARVRSSVRNMTLLESTRVTGLLTERSAAGLLVTGVTTSRSEARELKADLVVDASGRNSKSLEWLAAAGVKRPEEELVDSFSGYASRFYELAPNPDRWWRGMVIDTQAPACPRWGLLMPIENDRVVLTLGGVNGDYPPSDEAGFHAHLNSLLSPAMAREIERAKPVSGIHAYRALYNRARHFESWSEEVGGFVALADSALVFNPYHGQGMTMAVLAANTLGHCCSTLAHADAYTFTRRFHEAQWKGAKTAWGVATGIDMEWAGTQGKRPLGYDLMFNLTLALVHASHEYPELKRLMGPVYQLVAEPHTLLRPGLISLVVYAELRRRLGGRQLLTPKLDFSAISPWTSPLSPSAAGGLSAE
jgi:2-polyprenyl-6-methoxyphenol hydroxylase-like FAD-dependent oxidoreductase